MNARVVSILSENDNHRLEDQLRTLRLFARQRQRVAIRGGRWPKPSPPMQPVAGSS